MCAKRSEDNDAKAHELLFDLTPLHVDLKGITMRVLDGVLYLDGNISSQLRADIVEDQVLGVPGLLEIKNHLVGDDRLAADLAMALAQDPRTHDLPIGVYPRLGEVRLSGAVHTSQQKAVAEEIVRHFPGVRSVINDLVVDPQADLLPVMIPTGVEAEDQVPGKYIRHTIAAARDTAPPLMKAWCRAAGSSGRDGRAKEGAMQQNGQEQQERRRLLPCCVYTNPSVGKCDYCASRA